MSVFRSDDNFIYLDIPYAEFYIPMYYFDTTRKFAEDLSNKINVFGFFNVGIFSNGVLKEMRTLKMPTMITIFVHDSETREVKLTDGSLTMCKVVKYLKDSKVMQSRYFDNDSNVKAYLKNITGGNLPNTIPYSKALEIWNKNQEINNVGFGVSSTYKEIILAQAYRNPNDLSQKFSKIACNPGVGDYDYATASIRQICQYNSTFSALTYEDIDSMITTSLNKSREHKRETESPLEQIIKF